MRCSGSVIFTFRAVPPRVSTVIAAFTLAVWALRGRWPDEDAPFLVAEAAALAVAVGTYNLHPSSLSFAHCIV